MQRGLVRFAREVLRQRLPTLCPVVRRANAKPTFAGAGSPNETVVPVPTFRESFASSEPMRNRFDDSRAAVMASGVTVSCALAALFAALGSNVDDAAVAALVTAPGLSPRTLIVTLADAPEATSPSAQATVVVPLQEPALGVAETSASVAGSASVTVAACAGHAGAGVGERQGERDGGAGRHGRSAHSLGEGEVSQLQLEGANVACGALRA